MTITRLEATKLSGELRIGQTLGHPVLTYYVVVFYQDYFLKEEENSKSNRKAVNEY